MRRFDHLHLPIVRCNGKPHVDWLGKLVPLIRTRRHGGNRLIDLTNKRFGRLFVLARDGSNVKLISRWLCQCDCGRISTVRSDNLRDGSTTSCGCWRIEQAKANLARWRRVQLESTT